MILADKIISLRKKAGWSQEELAQQLGVSRQSVSKWEGAQSVPDLDRILQLSRLFGVTTDDLLKDEIEEFGPAAESDEPALRRVTMEQSAQYLVLRRKAAPQMALATLLCVLSPIPLLMLAALSEKHRIPLTEEAAAGLGLCALMTPAWFIVLRTHSIQHGWFTWRALGLTVFAGLAFLYAQTRCGRGKSQYVAACIPNQHNHQGSTWQTNSSPRHRLR